jgi:hypothetical protein
VKPEGLKVVTPSRVVDVYQCFERTYCLHTQDGRVVFTEDGSCRNLRNVGNYLVRYTASHCERVNLIYNYLVGCDAV